MCMYASVNGAHVRNCNGEGKQREQGNQGGDRFCPPHQRRGPSSAPRHGVLPTLETQDDIKRLHGTDERQSVQGFTSRRALQVFAGGGGGRRRRPCRDACPLRMS